MLTLSRIPVVVAAVAEDPHGGWNDLAACWAIGDWQQLRLLARGRSHRYWLRTTEGEFLLRRCAADKAESDLAFEHALQAKLAAAQVPVAQPVRCAQGKFWQRCNGRFWTVARYGVGAPYHGAGEELRAVARVLAAIHRALYGWQCPLPAPAAFDPLEAAGVVLLRLPHAQAFVEEAFALSQSLRCLPEAPCGAIVHGGLRAGSVSFDDDRVVLVSDLDRAGSGTRAQDLSVALLSFAPSASAHEPLAREPARAFLATYGELAGAGGVGMVGLPRALAAMLLYRAVRAVEQAACRAAAWPLERLAAARAIANDPFRTLDELGLVGQP